MAQTSNRVTREADPSSCCPDLEALIDPELFKALGDPNRVALIADIGRRGRPTTVGEAAACCPVDLSVVSRHLAVLRRAGVVEAERNGREVRYTLSAADLAASLRSLADALEACCPPEPSTGAGPTKKARRPTPPTEA
jgi:DNA-binding transcriptional ArsR family regulator